MQVICLDFDGVICDSAGELGATGWRAAARLWPSRFAGEAPPDFIAAFCRLRPVIETGYESIPLARLIADKVAEAEIMEAFPRLIADLCRAEKLTREALIALFGGIRDRWLIDDPGGWLDLHGFYPGVPELMRERRAAGDAIFIITTKEKRFAHALLERAGVPLPPEQVFGLEAGNKRAVLRGLQARPEFAGASFSFVEDRLATLEDVAAAADLNAVRLGFASWGFCTPAQCRAAAALTRLSFLTLDNFPRWIGA